MTSNEVLRDLFNDIRGNNRLPVMFIGSGLAKRYTTNQYDWKGLLIKCIEAYDENPSMKYKWYIERIRSDRNIEEESHMMYKLLGAQIQTDFNMLYYEGKFVLQGISDNEKPLKFYIKSILQDYEILEEMKPELEMLKKLKDKMLTVITTNYDTFLEDHVFINHEKIIKQKIFTGSELGTLMKIHGCITDPNSMVLTEFDYDTYYKKSKVLAAKVINLFAENPVFFFGYSITDENIRDFLQDVYSCLDTPEEFSAFEKRLVIIDFNPLRLIPAIGPHTLDINNVRINMTKISLSDFTPLYEEMSNLKNFTQLKEIQRLKSLVYEIVHDYDGEKKRVINLMEDDDNGDEVVVVIGKASHLMDATGITGIKSEQLFHDLVYDDLISRVSVNVLVEMGLPNLLKGTVMLPIHKYLSMVDRSKVTLDNRVITAEQRGIENLLTKSILKDEDSYAGSNYKTLEDIYLSKLPTTKKLHFLIFQAMFDSSVEELERFLELRYEEIQSYWTGNILRKLVCILDIKKYKQSAQ
ncbi:SIR2 family protein [Paenibacillus sp. P32E]|uniref:SIR2 family protein n=1 Tax=Paenibacillus sp. P32E TaxID=1349434 RepID=UPI00093AA690|nr:SIR2 family protein [Paenibacillus sp. P32E]OKP91345.1 hypothetical protein A3848_09565 [Paenibacillus sp. P32E]